MPYKHIAAHLKKTELACRLHYHQLSHGSNRRKRTTPASSGSPNCSHSPTLQTSMPSPIHELDDGGSIRSVSPPGSAGSYGPASPGGIQLPSIMTATAGSTTVSPRLPTILPKPASMNLALATMTASAAAAASVPTSSPTASRGYPTPLSEMHPHSAPLLAPSGFRGAMTPTSAGPPLSARTSNGSAPPPLSHHHSHQQHHGGPGPLRLDCSALPPPPSSSGTASAGGYGGTHSPFPSSHPVDMGRLGSIYNAHRASFWAAIAADYGAGANPVVLEQAWRGSSSSSSNSGPVSSMAALGIAAQTPITPVGSPDDHLYGTPTSAQGYGYGYGGKTSSSSSDKTRISAILGIDANPRSPREREMVRRLEEERCVSVGGVGA